MNPAPLHLVIVEDEDAHVEAIRRAFDLVANKPDIQAVGTLREYRERIATSTPDLALVDLNLPDGRATELLTHPVADAPFPILVMTAYGNEQTVVEVMKSGALDYVVKSPESFAAMPQTVERALREWQLLQQRKRSEVEIRELNLSLEQRVQERTVELLAANQELESFAYSVSHDLRAPLRAMNGFSRILLDNYGATLPNEAREHLNKIVSGGQRMGELIDGLLTLARSTQRELRRDAVDLSVMAARLLGDLAAAEPDRCVTWTVEPGLSARGDERMLEVVMTNLLGNAWKYTGKTPQPTIRVYGQRPGDQPEFCVADNGAGFEMKHATHLFQPFQRQHRENEFPGIGIGLATVQRIVHRHGGTIRVTAAPQQGATFVFSLSA